MEMVDPIYHSPLAAECQAIMHGIRLLQQMQIKDACVYSDSVNAIKMINGEQIITSEVYQWVIRIRIGNRKVDFLARDALDQNRSMLWFSQFPLELLSMGPHVLCKCTTRCDCLI